MFNPVAYYRYLLPTMYLFMADIANADLFVCRIWISLDITRFYEEQRQPSSGFTRPACSKTVNLAPFLGVGAFDNICTAVCNRCDSSTACRLCRLDSVHIDLTFYAEYR